MVCCVASSYQAGRWTKVITMRKLIGVLAVLGLIAGINAAVDSVRDCQCEGSCWCKTRWGRHIRWWVPTGHKLRSET